MSSTRIARWKARVFFEPRDVWIGVYWDAKPLLLNVYICVLPCLPLLVQIWRGRR